MQKFFVLFFLAFSCFLAAEPSLQKVDNTIQVLEDMDSLVNDALRRFNIPGAAIGVVVDNQLIFAQGYGFRNLEQKLPVTKDTVFRIASCSKAFTALLLAQLAEEGKISWDDPVRQHIPEFHLFDPNLTSKVTIRDLIAHRTGIPRYDALWICFPNSKIDIWKTLPYLEPACGLREKFYYNNLMYCVAGKIIERITGQTWEEAVTDRIFTPLAMMHSTTSIEEMQGGTDFSLPYAEVDDELNELPMGSFHEINPAGGINSTIPDLAKWVSLQLSDENYVIQRETLQEMHAVQMPLSPPPFESEIILQGYGLGWFVGTYRNAPFISHGGLINGFVSEIAMLPEKKAGLVILTNSSSDGRFFTNAIRNKIFDVLLEKEDIDWIAKENRDRKKIKKLLNDTNEKEDAAIPSRSLEEYVGQYEHTAFGTIEINIQENHLLASYGTESIFLKYKSHDLFEGKLSLLATLGIKRISDFAFCVDSTNQIDGLHAHLDPDAKPIRFKRKTTFVP